MAINIYFLIDYVGPQLHQWYITVPVAIAAFVYITFIGYLVLIECRRDEIALKCRRYFASTR